MARRDGDRRTRGSGVQRTDGAVFWPADDDPLSRLTGPGFPVESSDHRLVGVDVSHGGFPRT